MRGLVRRWVLAGLATPALVSTSMAAGPTLVSRVDDTGTIVSSPVVAMAWRQSVPGRRADHAVEAVVGVRVRLNLSPWAGRRIHLYMVLAPTPGRLVQASWQGGGRLLPGVLKSGERALVFSGLATSPALAETLELTVTTDGRTLESPAQLSFHFETEPA
jgi:hypothetical protein